MLYNHPADLSTGDKHSVVLTFVFNAWTNECSGRHWSLSGQSSGKILGHCSLEAKGTVIFSRFLFDSGCCLSSTIKSRGTEDAHICMHMTCFPLICLSLSPV